MILSIDTSGEVARVKLFDPSNSQMIDEDSIPGFQMLSEQLLVTIEKLLARNLLTKKDLGSILVNRGPGSYTGVRIGVTTANLLAYALDIPVHGGDFSQSKKESVCDKFTSPVNAIYDKPPHITKRRVDGNS